MIPRFHTAILMSGLLRRYAESLKVKIRAALVSQLS